MMHTDYCFFRSKAFLMLAFFTFAFSSIGMAQDLPGEHDRWIGTIEGSMVDDQGSGLVYDFHFSDDGTVTVEKSMTVRKLIQTFDWTYDGQNVVLSGDASGAIGELSNSELRYIDETRYEFIHVDGISKIELRRSKPLYSWLHLLLLFVILMVGNELSRYYRGVSYLLYFILPFAMIPLWLKAGFDGWFRWIKLYSAIAGGLFFTIFRYHNIDTKKWAKFVVMAILGINIAEAVMQDFSQPDLPNIINAVAGVLCIVTMSRWMGIMKDPSKPHDMLWPGMTTGWILAYDIWNIVFVYINFPNTVAFSFVVLLAPTLAAIYIKKGTYLQARAFTLAIYMMYLFTLKNFADNSLGLSFVIPLPRNENIVMGLALFSLAFNLVYFILHFRWRFTGKAPANIEVGQSESVLA